MPTAPTGTVTLLFTDIEGSTRLLQQLGEHYPATLTAHQRLLRDVFQAWNGYEVDTEGDSFFVTFARATDAVAAAVAVALAADVAVAVGVGECGTVAVGVGLGVGVGLATGVGVGLGLGVPSDDS